MKKESCFKTEDQIRTIAQTKLVGSEFTLTEENIDPWINFALEDTGIVEIQGVCGTFEMTEDGLIVVIDEDIVAPCGACIDFELSIECEPVEPCFTELTDLDVDTRFVVLDCEDCPTLHVTWGQICEFIAEQACVKVCEQLCAMGVKEEVTAGMKIVTVTGEDESCECALLPVEALQCDVEPEPFCCGDDPCDP